MVEAFSIILQILTSLSLICLLLGFIRPVYVLWFMDRCNRLKVLQLYGTLAVIGTALYYLLP